MGQEVACEHMGVELVKCVWLVLPSSPLMARLKGLSQRARGSGAAGMSRPASERSPPLDLTLFDTGRTYAAASKVQA